LQNPPAFKCQQYTASTGNLEFLLRQLGSQFLIFTRALPLRQWSLSPDTKICAASLQNPPAFKCQQYI